MGRDSKIVLEEINSLIASMEEDSVKWLEKENKSAAARIRKATLQLEKLGKEFRKLSVKE